MCTSASTPKSTLWVFHVFSPEADQFFLFNKTNKNLKYSKISVALINPFISHFYPQFPPTHTPPSFSSLYSLDANPLPENVKMNKLVTAISSSIDCHVFSKHFLDFCPSLQAVPPKTCRNACRPSKQQCGSIHA